MTKKRLSNKRQKVKPKKIGSLFNKVFDDFKKKQKNQKCILLVKVVLGNQQYLI